MFSPRSHQAISTPSIAAPLSQPKVTQPSQKATDTWGHDDPHVKLLARVLNDGPLRRPATRLRKRYEDKSNAQNPQAVARLAKGIADIYAVSPKHVSAIAAAVGKNSDIVRIRQVGEQLSTAARYAPIWRKLVEHEDFTSQTGTHFADYKFARPLELISRLDRAILGSMFPADLEDVCRAVTEDKTLDAMCTQLADIALWAEKSSLQSMLFGAPASGEFIDQQVLTDVPTHDAVLRVARRLHSKTFHDDIVGPLRKRLIPLLAKFCAPCDATLEQRRATLSAELQAWPEVQQEYAQLRALGYAMDNARHERAYTLHDTRTGKSLQVTVAFANDIFSAADSCVSSVLGGCYATDSGVYPTKPLENGVSPASRFISVRDLQGKEIEVTEVSFTKQGLWADRFERDHPYDTAPMWTDYFQHLVRAGVVPSVIVRAGDTRGDRKPLFERMHETHPDWRYCGPTIPLQRINVLFRNTYYDAELFDNAALEAERCLHITPDNLR